MFHFFLFFLIAFIFRTDFLLPQELSDAEIESQRLGARILTEKGLFTIENLIEYTKAKEDEEILWETELSYGLTESFGLILLVPFFIRNKIVPNHSSGLGDILLTGEWSFFRDHTHHGLLTTGLKFPTGSVHKTPITGTGTIDLFLEFSAIHSSEKWYASIDTENFIRIPRKDRKPGNSYDWEIIFGRLVKFNDHALYINMDLFILFNTKDTIGGTRDLDSGGTVIFLGPLISWEHKKVLCEFLFQWPIGQNLFGNQPKFDFTTYFSCKITF